MRPLGLPIAVISNASLIWREDVRADLNAADWVALKVDSVGEETWQQVNRPHGRLDLASILEGALRFAASFEGDLATETMLVAGLNDSEAQFQPVADFLARLEPDIAYLSIPTRPPAEAWARAPDEGAVNRAYHCLREKVDHLEYLIGYEGNAFAFTGDVEQDLLSITAVHPMREDAVQAFLARARAGWPVVQRLVAQGQLVEAQHNGRTFYIRKLAKPGFAPAA